MKRYVTVLAFAAITAMNALAQSIESPVCYAIESNLESTLKYKFLYQDENYFIALRLIKKSTNLFKVGDKIIFLTADSHQYIFTISDKEVSTASEYYTFNLDYADLYHFQKGIEKITSVRDGKSCELEPTRYCNATTKEGAKDIARDAISLEKKKEQSAYRLEKQKEENTYKEAKAKQHLALVQTKAQLINEEKATGFVLPDVKFYNRVYLAYTPTQLSDNMGGGYAEGFTFGYTGGLCLNRKSKTYLEFGVQGDYYRASKSWNAFAISIPIAITKRFELGNSGATLSPFIGPVVRFNVRESGSDVFQIGGQGGLNLDYKHLNVGIAYHLEAWIKGGGHTRGLVFRLGCTF